MDLAQAATEVLAPLGFEVLELSVSGQGGKRRVLLRIDRLDEARVSMDDVTLATEVFGLELDRLDPFESPYRLEVESPGAERPLLRARHFERFRDLAAKVRTGGETVKGVIRGVENHDPENHDLGNHGVDNRGGEGGTLLLEVGGEIKRLPIAEVQAWLAEWPSEPR